jgi:hypothetical protein
MQAFLWPEATGLFLPRQFSWFAFAANLQSLFANGFLDRLLNSSDSFKSMVAKVYRLTPFPNEPLL